MLGADLLKKSISCWCRIRSFSSAYVCVCVCAHGCYTINGLAARPISSIFLVVQYFTLLCECVFVFILSLCSDLILSHIIYVLDRVHIRICDALAWFMFFRLLMNFLTVVRLSFVTQIYNEYRHTYQYLPTIYIFLVESHIPCVDCGCVVSSMRTMILWLSDCVLVSERGSEKMKERD